MYREELEVRLEHISEQIEEVKKKLDKMHHLRTCLDGDALLDTQDVADVLRITPRSVQRYVKAGKLKSKKIFGNRMFLNSEVLRFIKDVDYEK
jgi:hypothetical protein